MHEHACHTEALHPRNVMTFAIPLAGHLLGLRFRPGAQVRAALADNPVRPPRHAAQAGQLGCHVQQLQRAL